MSEGEDGSALAALMAVPAQGTLKHLYWWVVTEVATTHIVITVF